MLQRHGELLFAVLVAVLFVVQVTSEEQFEGSRAVALAAAGGFCVALAFGRRAPVVPLTAGALLMVISNQWTPPLANTGTFFVAYVVAVYWAGRYLGGRSVLPAMSTRSFARTWIRVVFLLSSRTATACGRRNTGSRRVAMARVGFAPAHDI